MPGYRFQTKALLRIPALLLALGCTAAADQVLLKNGDLLNGEIIRKDGLKLTLKSQFLGELHLPWSSVKSLISDESLTVALPGGDTVEGKVATAGEVLEVATPEGVRSAPLVQVKELRNPEEQRSWERLQHPRLYELWTGFFDIGFSLARGNARTDTLTTGFAATRATRHDKVTFSLNQIYGGARVQGVTSSTANALRASWLYNRDLMPRVFVSTFNQYEYDRFQNLNFRFVGSGGFGVNALKTGRTNFTFSGGADYNRENFKDSVLRNSAELNFGDDFVHKFSPGTNVTQEFRFFSNVTVLGAYRVNFDVSAVTALRKWLGWHVTASDRYLSNPVEGRQRNDLLVSTGFRISFAE